MPRSLHMIKHYQRYNEELYRAIEKSKNSKSKGNLAYFLFYCYIVFWGYVFWMKPIYSLT